MAVIVGLWQLGEKTQLAEHRKECILRYIRLLLCVQTECVWTAQFAIRDKDWAASARRSPNKRGQPASDGLARCRPAPGHGQCCHGCTGHHIPQVAALDWRGDLSRWAGMGRHGPAWAWAWAGDVPGKMCPFAYTGSGAAFALLVPASLS
jgi:hypothetical protein